MTLKSDLSEQFIYQNTVFSLLIRTLSFQSQAHKVVDYTTDAMCIEVTGDPSKIDAFVQLMRPFGIIEMCRTGIVALERGTASLLDK